MKKNKPINISNLGHLYPFQSHYLDLNGLKYHYIDEGAGEPVVMLHGNPTWSFYYRELIKGLSPQYRTIAVDHIGCGLSDKPSADRYSYRLKQRVDDLAALIDHLKIKEKLTLVVHDWGGMIGMAYALRHLDRIGRLILTNTAGFLPPKGRKIPMRLRLIRNTGPLAAVSVLGLNLFANAALFMASRRRLVHEVKAGLTAPYNCWKNRIATLKFVQDIPLQKSDPSYDLVRYVDDHLHELSRIPMLICWGEHDFVFDMDYLAEWQRRFPKAKICRFPDAGHYLLEDQPAPIIRVVSEFLKEAPLKNNHVL